MSEHPTIAQALSAVMGDVQAVGKTGHNSSQNYNFRGIDAVVNAVGPAFRQHGIVCMPTVEGIERREYATRSGSAMLNVSVLVRYVFTGPAGDHLDCVVWGEAADSGDKATSKAFSVAYRTALLQALCIPTDEPDPDSSSHERATTPPPPEMVSAADGQRMADLLNAATADDRKAFMQRFGCSPKALPITRLAEADDFLSDLEVTA